MVRSRRGDEIGIDTETIADGVGTVSGFLGTPGHVIGSAASVVGAEARGDKERKRIERAGIDLVEASRYSRAAKRKLKMLEERSGEVLYEGLATIAGGGAVAWGGSIVGNMIMPGIGGWGRRFCR